VCLFHNVALEGQTYLLGESMNDVQKINLLLAILRDFEEPVWSKPDLRLS
jgi:hypothetical protein